MYVQEFINWVYYEIKTRNIKPPTHPVFFIVFGCIHGYFLFLKLLLYFIHINMGLKQEFHFKSALQCLRSNLVNLQVIHYEKSLKKKLKTNLEKGRHQLPFFVYRFYGLWELLPLPPKYFPHPHAWLEIQVLSSKTNISLF